MSITVNTSMKVRTEDGWTDVSGIRGPRGPRGDDADIKAAEQATEAANQAAENAQRMAGLAEDGYDAAMNAAGNANRSADYAQQMGNAASAVASDIQERAQAGEFDGKPFRIDYIVPSVSALPSGAKDGQYAVINSDVEDPDNAKLFMCRDQSRVIDNQPLTLLSGSTYRSEHVALTDGAKYRAIVHDAPDAPPVYVWVYALNGHPKGEPDDVIVSGHMQIDGNGGWAFDGADAYVEYTANFSRLPFDRWDELYIFIQFQAQANATLIDYSKGVDWQLATDMSGAKGAKGDKGAPGKTPVKGVDYFDGEPGKTPVRGTDYWTAADVATIDQHIDQRVGQEYEVMDKAAYDALTSYEAGKLYMVRW